MECMDLLEITGSEKALSEKSFFKLHLENEREPSVSTSDPGRVDNESFSPPG